MATIGEETKQEILRLLSQIEMMQQSVSDNLNRDADAHPNILRTTVLVSLDCLESNAQAIKRIKKLLED